MLARALEALVIVADQYRINDGKYHKMTHNDWQMPLCSAIVRYAFPAH
jgi:hypothetical protein